MLERSRLDLIQRRLLRGRIIRNRPMAALMLLDHILRLLPAAHFRPMLMLMLMLIRIRILPHNDILASHRIPIMIALVRRSQRLLQPLLPLQRPRQGTAPIHPRILLGLPDGVPQRPGKVRRHLILVVMLDILGRDIGDRVSA